MKVGIVLKIVNLWLYKPNNLKNRKMEREENEEVIGS